MLTFKDILQEYTPVEEGDFFLKFQIKEMFFVLYQDKVDENVKCIEMMTFSCISIQRLSLLLGAFVEKSGEEYKFGVSSTKEIVLAYIFDVFSLDESDSSYERVMWEKERGTFYTIFRDKFGTFLRFQKTDIF